ncbi:MAG: heavy metal-binding domain-containing protein, partial [Isosphaeraceae bacterium]
GRFARQGKSAAATVEIPIRLAPWIAEGQDVEVRCPDLAGVAPFAGRIRSLDRPVDQGREIARVTVAMGDPPLALAAGMIAEVRFHTDVATLDPFRALPRDPPRRGPREAGLIYVCHDHPETIAVEAGRCPVDGKNRMSRPLGDLERVRWGCPMHPEVQAGEPGRTCQQCGDMALQPRIVYFAPPRQVLAVPQSAVVDTGVRQVVFVESMPGMFDAVEVELGPRCGDFYPIVRGIEPGQLVAVSGAFLLDAETRLNPSLAAAYFGAARRDRDHAAAPAAEPAVAVRPADDSTSLLSSLKPADRALAERQKTCPVTGKTLGSMGTPKRVEVSGQVVFLCCKGCEAALRNDPERYLAKLPDADRGRP